MPGDAVRVVLEDARRLGFLGPDRVERHIEHAEAWADLLARPQHPAAFLDLGSGAGVPGLILAFRWPEARGFLLDSQLRRTAWLRIAVARLGLVDRVTVLEGRAEDLGHSQDLRERFPLVVARSFSTPALTAERGSSFVVLGGELSVSEPPDSAAGRWPPGPLARLGLGNPHQVVHESGSFVILPKDAPLNHEFPRRHNVSTRDPVW